MDGKNSNTSGKIDLQAVKERLKDKQDKAVNNEIVKK